MFLWKSREEMTATERRWKWVKKESLPADLVTLMDKLRKPSKADKQVDEDGNEQKKVREEKEVREDVMTQIKRDYLNDDFTLFPICKEVIDLLKEERMKSKFSADYHAQVLDKIFLTMPSVEPHEIKTKIEVISMQVNMLFQTARSSFLKRDQWVTVHERVNQLLELAQTPHFIEAL